MHERTASTWRLTSTTQLCHWKCCIASNTVGYHGTKFYNFYILLRSLLAIFLCIFGALHKNYFWKTWTKWTKVVYSVRIVCCCLCHPRSCQLGERQWPRQTLSEWQRWVSADNPLHCTPLTPTSVHIGWTENVSFLLLHTTTNQLS